MERKAWVRWSRPFEFKNVFKQRPPVATDHYGIYMILEDIGDGRGRKLIYIGIVWSDTRDLLTRMNGHRKDWLGKVAKNQIFVKFGVIETYGKLDRQLIEDVESALIMEHQPRENTAKKKSYKIYDELVIENENAGGYVKKRIDTRKH